MLFIVNEYQRLVVLRWGKYRGTFKPGIRWTWPVMETASKIDLRCLLYTSPSPRDATLSRMPSSA